MPVGATHTTAQEALLRLQRMMDTARLRGLLSSPPYSTQRERHCWEAGYETALADIAKGKLSGGDC